MTPPTCKACRPRGLLATRTRRAFVKLACAPSKTCFALLSPSRCVISKLLLMVLHQRVCLHELCFQPFSVARTVSGWDACSLRRPSVCAPSAAHATAMRVPFCLGSPAGHKSPARSMRAPPRRPNAHASCETPCIWARMCVVSVEHHCE